MKQPDTIPEKPTRPCSACKEVAWYWPGDYYFGKKIWLCGKCCPPPVTKLTDKR